jgi:SNF2 family DNA or RNA helicase
MIDWLKRETHHLTRAFSPDGISIVSNTAALTDTAPEFKKRLSADDIEGFLHQLEDEAYALRRADGYSISWDTIYDLLQHRDYAPSLALLHVPAVREYSPVLQSRNSLADQTFSISIAGWRDGGGQRADPVQLTGPLFRSGEEVNLLPQRVWQLVRRVSAFTMRDHNHRTADAHRRAWGEIRRLALAAKAQMDAFLFQTVVLTPERLDIRLAKTEIGGSKVIEIIPEFADEPERWLHTFDTLRQVPDRYDIPTPNGIVQVLIIPEVKTVLEQIKRIPGRRAAGSRAEAFITNPFAALGEDAARTIDSDQFERARAEASLLFERFTAHVKLDAAGYAIEVGLLIEQTDPAGPASSELRLFANDEELLTFVKLVRQRLSEGMQLCAWDGYDFELLGDTPREVELLEKAYGERRKSRTLINFADIYDLTRYADRIEIIGEEKPYYSPFIAKKNNDEGWLPENFVPVIAWTPEDGGEPIAVPLTDQLKDQIEAKVAEAKAAGRDEINLSGFDKPLPVREAEFILETFRRAAEDIKKGEFDPSDAGGLKTDGLRPRPGLVIHANIKSIDYEEARRDILTALPGQPKLPKTLKPDVRLKDHQTAGIAWLQYIFDKTPHYFRGAVLADDMGLGKTLQLLVFIMSVFEERPDSEPALVVAPVALLENWIDEIDRFFVQDAVPRLLAYGDGLARLRVPRASIDQQLQNQGLIKFLRSGWRGVAKIVLTTYETLRDLEFSFAAEKWSIMVCDEAQKIKNPNALVTRAAKKQNVQFKIACTGTPVENTLADLWCLFDFVQPGLLGALNDFGRHYRKPIEAETEEEMARIEELRAKIGPQMLRRTKEHVAKDLPRKIIVESCRHLPLSPSQRMLYGQAIELFRRRLDPGGVTPFKNHLSLLHYLRLVCVDPRRHGLNEFRPEPLRDYRKRAPKLEWLLSQLEQIRRSRERAIIFCEFRAIQRLLRHYIEEVFDYTPDIINGDSSPSAGHQRSRQKRINDFQAQPGFGAIILSPLAVGFGLNIQAANHVIHYTRTWNPAKEDQATDRAYRIGQTRDVHVYYPVVRANDFVTFDEKLDRLLERKRELARDMLNGAGDVSPNDFSLDDMIPDDLKKESETKLTLDDVLHMRSNYFECLVAVLWQRKGFGTVYRTPDSYDDGVDVVAVGSSGELIQCKSSTVDNTNLGWNAIKDVVTGEAAYRARHPGICFKKRD